MDLGHSLNVKSIVILEIRCQFGSFGCFGNKLFGSVVEILKNISRTELCLHALRQARRDQGLSLKQLGYRMGMSPTQIQRREIGARRLTVRFLEDYCDAVNLDILNIFNPTVAVPIIGTIDSDANIQPLPVGSPNSVRPPRIVCHPERLASIRWGSKAPFKAMEGHIGFFYADVIGLQDDIWGKACVMRRSDGSQRLGCPLQVEGQVHIKGPGHETELNAKLVWASPLLATISPEVLQ